MFDVDAPRIVNAWQTSAWPPARSRSITPITRGWWAVERDGQVMSRWTDGEAVLPLPAMSGTVMLELHLAGSMTYAMDAAPEDGIERRAA